jgi:hypothetical protein
MVTCDVCKTDQPDPVGWFTVRKGTYGTYDAVFIEQDRPRLHGHQPEGMKHACSRDCLAEAVKKAVEKWKTPKQKEV